MTTERRHGPVDGDAIARTANDLEVRFRAHQRTARVWRGTRGLPSVSRRLARALINRLASADINAAVDLPPGVILMHRGLGSVFHERTQIAAPAIVFHRVTIGNSWARVDGVPRIEPFTFVGAGASILGPVTVGPFAAVSAGAVVTRDVPPFTIASGAPAVCTTLDDDSIVRWFRLSAEELNALRLELF